MAKKNVKRTPGPAPRTHEGAPADRINPEQALRRSLMTCLLWEDTFYEDGVAIGDRIASLVPKVEPKRVQEMAIEARERMKLRHAPLWVALAMLQSPDHKLLIADTIARVIQRADESAELLSLYWKDGRKPIANQIKRGLARAFPKFDAYQLGKYKGKDDTVAMRDVMFLVHPKPPIIPLAPGNVPLALEAQPVDRTKYKRGTVDRHASGMGHTYAELAEGRLRQTGTWEDLLSEAKTPEARLAVWIGLINERKLGAMALLRNLRNMEKDKVPEETVKAAIANMKAERVLPFRFVTAARYAPKLEPELEAAMFRCLAGQERLPGKTVILVDVSGSMDATISSKSELLRIDAAAALAMLIREIADSVVVYTFSDNLVLLPARRGMALRDAIKTSQHHGGTWLGQAVDDTNKREVYDRIIVISDEQAMDLVSAPKARGYMINVASYQNGVGYRAWTHIDGWSEAIIDYVREVEREGANESGTV